MTNPTFYETIVSSPQWQEWVKVNEENPQWDVHESMECGWLSAGHFQAFLEWTQKPEERLEHLILMAYPDIREITFHSDGRVIAKTGARARQPKKLYAIRPVKDVLPHYGEMATEAVKKLIDDNKISQ
jgi:hypothetical protein